MVLGSDDWYVNQGLWEMKVFEDVTRSNRVGIYLGLFRGGQGAFFEKHRIGYAYLSDVVKKRSILDGFECFIVKVHFTSYHKAILGHTLGVAGG